MTLLLNLLFVLTNGICVAADLADQAPAWTLVFNATAMGLSLGVAFADFVSRLAR